MTPREKLITDLAALGQKKDFVTILPEFIIQLEEYLGWTEFDIALYYGVEITSVKAKKKIAEERGILGRQGGNLVFKGTFVAESGLEDMTVDEKIAWIDKKLDCDIAGKGKLQTDDRKALKDRRADLVAQRNEEVVKGAESLDGLLNFFRHDFIPLVKELFEKAFANAKKEIAFKVFTYMWGTLKGEVSETPGDEELKESMLNQAIKVVEDDGKVFDIQDMFVEATQKSALVKNSVDGYLAKSKKPRYTGGGAIAQEGSIQGGQQWRLKKDREAKDGT